MKYPLRPQRVHFTKLLSHGTISGGWPDRIVDGVAVEDKFRGDRLSNTQIACHEWLFEKTGAYPLIHYLDDELNLHVFESYHAFYEWLARPQPLPEVPEAPDTALPYLASIGKKGGAVASEAQKAAARLNGLKPCKAGKKRGRPKKDSSENSPAVKRTTSER